MDDVRILKGWTKEERKELEEAKDTENLGDFLHAITEYRYKVTHYQYVWDKYDAAKTQDQFSIIQDIVDFYTDKAKFPEPKKYYVHFIKGDEYSYLNINSEGGAELGTKFGFGHWKTKFTRDEVVAIDPRLVVFMEEVKDDE
ncbi:hypothetical protein [Companilactobacillus nuruki]|uniref:DUF1642 domain-containing protein n=1 Tax=Companilactobacillus nuruki TaxID=1993540 RepID=A0A2N7AV12_9LACO|nr:hypothetical protein [Companilactobacillus nuruki]PMD71483.1 hypothetical protein CBP76_05065 [Companilactobacillus nuruki]